MYCCTAQGATFGQIIITGGPKAFFARETCGPWSEHDGPAISEEVNSELT